MVKERENEKIEIKVTAEEEKVSSLEMNPEDLDDKEVPLPGAAASPKTFFKTKRYWQVVVCSTFTLLFFLSVPKFMGCSDKDILLFLAIHFIVGGCTGLDNHLEHISSDKTPNFFRLVILSFFGLLAIDLTIFAIAKAFGF